MSLTRRSAQLLTRGLLGLALLGVALLGGTVQSTSALDAGSAYVKLDPFLMSLIERPQLGVLYRAAHP